MVLTGRGAKSPCSPLRSLSVRLKPTWCHPLQRPLGSHGIPLLGNRSEQRLASVGRGATEHPPPPTSATKTSGPSYLARVWDRPLTRAIFFVTTRPPSSESATVTAVPGSP